jgi:hypothetical protein
MKKVQPQHGVREKNLMIEGRKSSSTSRNLLIYNKKRQLDMYATEIDSITSIPIILQQKNMVISNLLP